MILSIVAALVAFVLALLLGVPYIDFLKKKMLGQYISCLLYTSPSPRDS